MARNEARRSGDCMAERRLPSRGICPMAAQGKRRVVARRRRSASSGRQRSRFRSLLTSAVVFFLYRKETPPARSTRRVEKPTSPWSVQRLLSESAVSCREMAKTAV